MPGYNPTERRIALEKLHSANTLLVHANHEIYRTRVIHGGRGGGLTKREQEYLRRRWEAIDSASKDLTKFNLRLKRTT